jgi:hypothetical protein
VADDPTKFYSLAQFETALHDDLTGGGGPGGGTVLGLSTYADRRAAALESQLP